MKNKQLCICVLLVFGFLGSSQADLVSDSGDVDLSDSISQFLFLRFTTALGGPWKDISFSWRTPGISSPTPNDFFADGTLHLSTTPFTTSFTNAGSHAGVIGSGVDTGSQYTFPGSLILAGGTQYYVAMDATFATMSPISFGGSLFNGFGDVDPDTVISSLPQDDAAVGYRVQGTAVPEPSAFLLLAAIGMSICIKKRFLQ